MTGRPAPVSQPGKRAGCMRHEVPLVRILREVAQGEPGRGAITAADLAAWRGLLVRYCQQVTSNAAAGEDLAHDTYLHALSHVGELRNSAAVWAWLRSIANRCRIDTVRRLARAPSSPLDDDEAPSLGVGPTQETALLAKEMVALAGRDAEAVALVLGAGFTYDEAATALGVTPASVRMRIYRAKKKST